jgi:hypothetical protein
LPVVFREPERQLSKKELKKKELAELDAVLAELGLVQKEENEYAGSVPLLEEKKPEEITDDTTEEFEDKGPGGTPSLTESKSSKRRKAKKEKSFKEGRDVDIPPTPESESGAKEEDSNGEEHGEGSTVDPKEILKRMTSLKKKKSMKEGDSAAKAAAAEVSARAARLAAAKKKEKNHYNQQPVR